jgi:hypothetical protein
MVSIGVTIVASARAESRSVRETKGGVVNFHMASTTPINGYDKVSLGTDNGVLYVGPRAVWTSKEVVSARTTDSADGAVMELTLSPEAAQRLSSELRHKSGDRLAIYADGKIVSSGTLGASSSGGRLTITGINSVSTEQVLKLLNGERPVPAPSPSTAGPVISLVPAGQSPDGLYLVDVFVQGATNLRTYQIGVVVTGGTSGELVRDELQIETARPDFVFGGRQAISAADQVGGRLGGVLVDGGVNRPAASYLGTYSFHPSPDAAGTFQVSIDTGPKSFLADAGNAMVEFRTAPAALINIDLAPTQRTNDK